MSAAAVFGGITAMTTAGSESIEPISPECRETIRASLRGLPDGELLRLEQDVFRSRMRAGVKLDELKRAFKASGISEDGPGSMTQGGWRASIRHDDEAKAAREVALLMDQERGRRREVAGAAEEANARRVVEEDLRRAQAGELELMHEVIAGQFDSPRARLRILQLISRVRREQTSTRAWDKWEMVPEDRAGEVLEEAGRLIDARLEAEPRATSRGRRAGEKAPRGRTSGGRGEG